MLTGNKKSDWYNDGIDVFALGTSLVEMFIYYLETNEDVDLNLLNIFEAMLSYNTC